MGMGGMSPPLCWVPEDDVLLKSAVEAGASLESLAKGAVKFSQKYTLKELKDRWWSLLYDPVTVMEASPHIHEIERLGLMNQSTPNTPEIAKEVPFGSRKRKSETIRKCYYAMRKRICNDPFNMMAIDLLHDQNSASNNLGTQGPEFDIVSQAAPEGVQFDQELDIMHNNLSLDEDHDGLPGPYPNITCSSSKMPQIPMRDTSPDICIPSQTGEQVQNERDAFIIPEPGNNAKEADNYLAEISNALFDDILFADNNGNETIDSSYYEGLSSLLLDAQSQAEVGADGGDLPQVEASLLDSQSQTEVGADGGDLPQVEASLLDSQSQTEVGADGGDLPQVEASLLDSQSQTEVGTNGGDLPQVEASLLNSQSQTEVGADSKSNIKVLGSEYTNGVICCTLNTEDPEIPSNEDVFIPFRFHSPSNFPRYPHWRSEDADVSKPLVKDSPSGCKLPPVAKSKQKDSCVLGTSKPLDKGLRNPVKEERVKFELPKSDTNHAVLRNTRTWGEGNRNRINSANLTANCYIGNVVIKRRDSVEKMDRGKNVNHGPVGVCVDSNHKGGLEVLESLQNNNCDDNVKEEILNVESQNNSCDDNVKKEILNVESLPNGDLSPKKENDKAQISDVEEWSENDVPSFSDVEAMILDMDLSPDEFCLYSNPEVQKYLHEECQRAIIRLEQAADACTHRAIASHSAFAVLYGRCSKHYIKKPEVLLGRSTEENSVDIDLGREKNGGKISRRQAIIKMDMNGIFQLTNLGKHSIYVNGNEVLSRQSSSLHSGCLIEVRGLAFIFETNLALVDQFVNSAGEGNLTDDSSNLG